MSKFVDTESIGILHHQREPQGMQVCARVRPCADGEASEITAKQIEARQIDGDEWRNCAGVRVLAKVRGTQKD